MPTRYDSDRRSNLFTGYGDRGASCSSLGLCSSACGYGSPWPRAGRAVPLPRALGPSRCVSGRRIEGHLLWTLSRSQGDDSRLLVPFNTPNPEASLVIPCMRAKEGKSIIICSPGKSCGHAVPCNTKFVQQTDQDGHTPVSPT